jgi:hypothetical protein
MAPQFPLPDPTQPKPLRIIAAVAGLVTLIIGGLPTVGVALTPVAIGWLSGVVGALATLAVALIGEQHVTPYRSPRAKDGTPLVRADQDEQP